MSRTRLLASSIALASATATTAIPAQEFVSLPLGDRRVTTGTEHTGMLTPDDRRLDDGTYAQAWALVGTGRTVTIDLLSEAFDAFLALAGPDLEPALTDDDGAGGCDARITHLLTEGATYHVVVNTVHADAVGAFTLRVTETPGASRDAPCMGMFDADPTDAEIDTTAVRALPRAGRLRLGETVAGTLDATDPALPDGERVQAWELDGRAGNGITVELRSEAFDAYLMALGPEAATVRVDDDGAGWCDARLTIADTPGTWLVLVSAISGEASGPFTLHVLEDPEPAPDQTCQRAPVPVADLDGLPVSGTLPFGDAVEDTLSTNDPELSHGGRARAYVLRGTAGRAVTIEMVSDFFDSYLLVTGPGLRHPLVDDDGAGRCDARVTMTFPETGEYRVVATSYGGGTGGFTLRAGPDAGPSAQGACGDGGMSEIYTQLAELAPRGTLEAEGEANDALGETDPRLGDGGPFVHVWELAGRAATSVTIDLLSDGFDAFLVVMGPGLPDPLLDDDCGGDRNARLVVTFPETATYRVVVTTFEVGETGPYSVFVTPGADEAAARCNAEGSDPDAVLEEIAAMTVTGAVAPGVTREGTLTPETAQQVRGSLMHVFEIAGTADSSVTIDLRSSDFDAALLFVGWGIDGILSDDDGAGGCDARLQVTFPQSGTFRVVVTTAIPGTSGRYVLRVTGEPGPVEPGACNG